MIQIAAAYFGELYCQLSEDICGVRRKVAQCGSADAAREARETGLQNGGGFGRVYVRAKAYVTRGIQVASAACYRNKLVELFSVNVLEPELFSPLLLQSL